MYREYNIMVASAIHITTEFAHAMEDSNPSQHKEYKNEEDESIMASAYCYDLFMETNDEDDDNIRSLKNTHHVSHLEKRTAKPTQNLNGENF